MNKNIFSTLVFGSSIVVAIGMTACSSTDSTKANVSAASAQSAQSGSRKQAASAVRQAQSETSLDALRRGESAGTPAGSPLREIYFDFDRYDLSSDARATLRRAGDWLKRNAAARIEIEGHCDERGTNEYNLALGAKRAQAAKDYLVSLGVANGRLSTISYGEEIPVCRDNSETCWQKNRRDRFVTLAPKPGV